MPKILVICDQLPIKVEQYDSNTDSPHEKFKIDRTSAGPAVPFRSLHDYDVVFIGSINIMVEDEDDQKQLADLLAHEKMMPVFLTQSEYQAFHNGFAKRTIWPHFHYFTQITTYTDSKYEEYYGFNRRFYDVILRNCINDDQAQYIWIHDYHFLLLPKMLRKKIDHVGIGFFLHIPFPSYEVFRTLPWRKDLLFGILGADYVAFNTNAYLEHFLETVKQICGIRSVNSRIPIGNRVVSVGFYPMGIDYDLYAGLDKSINNH
ncbi:hypothetical protein ACOME3_003186 [Neoechinorhynchus agilis]